MYGLSILHNFSAKTDVVPTRAIFITGTENEN